jgi:peroxiredoxin (alkyl hydroperoxide reductase subunit C)
MAVLVGKKAPDFTASAVINGEEIVENFKLSDYAGKYVILFFYPKDFTFVCPTELHAFQARKEEFASKGVELIAVSTDTEQSHWGWLQMSKDHGGIQGITYPIVADTNKTISHNYDVLDGEWSYDEDGNLTATGEMIAYRGLFLINKEGVVMRMVDALQYFEEKGEVCPANWTPGQDGMNATHDGVANYLANH